VENRRESPNLYNVATAFGQRPSAIIGLDDDLYTAYQFDSAILMIGRTCERLASDKADLETYLNGDTAEQYQAPPMEGLKKVKIGPDGVW